MNIVDSLINQAIEKGSKFASFSIILPDGTIKKAGQEKDEFVIRIKNKEVYSEIIRKGQLGLGEQYMLGNLDIEGDLYKALCMSAQLSVRDFDPTFLQRTSDRVTKLFLKNDRHNSLKNIVYHYDLGNDFYQEWLDKTLTYSCGYFKTKNDTIDQAEEQKLEHICRKLNLKAGETLVDIGCGWGSMLIYAAKKYKVKGYGVTLSKPQIEFAKQRAKEEGVEDLVTFEFKDYRDVQGKFDKFVSIGMFEHVGREFYDLFFKKIKEILVPQGLGLLHTISVDRPWNVDPWVFTYIFPGGYLPTPTMFITAATQNYFIPLDLENLRPHYNLTLLRWRENYLKVFDKTAKERGMAFARMWDLYLTISAANFKYGELRLYQLLFSNGINNTLDLTRDHIYK